MTKVMRTDDHSWMNWIGKYGILEVGWAKGGVMESDTSLLQGTRIGAPSIARWCRAIALGVLLGGLSYGLVVGFAIRAEVEHGFSGYSDGASMNLADFELRNHLLDKLAHRHLSEKDWYKRLEYCDYPYKGMLLPALRPLTPAEKKGG
jgi:hypothetical protein